MNNLFILDLGLCFSFTMFVVFNSLLSAAPDVTVLAADHFSLLPSLVHVNILSIL